MIKVNKRSRIPKGLPQMDNPEKLTNHGIQEEEKQNITQYVLDITIRTQTQKTSND
jgi:hypothetical protein